MFGPVLVFVTDETRPPGATRTLAELVMGRGGLVVFRDKRAAWNRALFEALAGPRLIVNVGPESAQLASACRGYHAPEAVWRAGAATEGLVSVADHDGDGIVYATTHRVPLAIVSPIYIDKGRPARGPGACAGGGTVQRIGLGGICTAQQAEELAAAGAAGAAVQRALYASAFPAALLDELEAPFRA